MPVRWRASANGFRFAGLENADLPTQWLDPDTDAQGNPGAAGVTGGGVSLLLGPEPIIGPQAVILVSRSQPAQRIRLATDGVRPFVVQAAAP